VGTSEQIKFFIQGMQGGHMQFDLMSSDFNDEEWLREAARLEDEAGCDIQAGPDLGANLGIYLASAKSYINHEKLMSILQEELGDLLSPEDLETIANAAQNCAQARVIEKFQSNKESA
jgi:hypothetical protein